MGFPKLRTKRSFMSKPQIVYICLYDLTQHPPKRICHHPSIKEGSTFSQSIQRLISHPVEKSEFKHSAMVGEHMVHRMGVGGIVLLAVTSKEERYRIVYDVLGRVMQKYEKCGGNSKKLKKFLKGEMENEIQDKISHVQGKIDSLSQKMVENIDVLLNQDEIDVLTEKTSLLEQQSKTYRKTGKKLKRRFFFRICLIFFMFFCILGCLLSFALTMIFLFLCVIRKTMIVDHTEDCMPWKW